MHVTSHFPQQSRFPSTRFALWPANRDSLNPTLVNRTSFSNAHNTFYTWNIHLPKDTDRPKSRLSLSRRLFAPTKQQQALTENVEGDVTCVWLSDPVISWTLILSGRVAVCTGYSKGDTGDWSLSTRQNVVFSCPGHRGHGISGCLAFHSHWGTLKDFNGLLVWHVVYSGRNCNKD